MPPTRQRDADGRVLSSGSRRGRRRDPSLDVSIQGAVLAVLADVGYAGMTMDAVAETAGVGKATIYRRWACKRDLLLSLIDAASDHALVIPDSGSLEDDLTCLLGALARVLAGPGGRASLTLLSSLSEDPVLDAAFRSGPLARWAEVFDTVLGRAVDRREIRPEARASLAVEAGPGIFLLRWAVSGAETSEALATAVVREVMMPLLRQR